LIYKGPENWRDHIKKMLLNYLILPVGGKIMGAKFDIREKGKPATYITFIN
jgi:hypothetical protein